MKIIYLFFILSIIVIPSYGQNNDSSITKQDLNELKQELIFEFNKFNDLFVEDILIKDEKQEKMIRDLNETLQEIDSKLETLQGKQEETSLSVWLSSNIQTMVTIAISLAAVITGISLSFSPIEKHQRKKASAWLGAGFLVGALLVLLLMNILNS